MKSFFVVSCLLLSQFALADVSNDRLFVIQTNAQVKKNTQDLKNDLWQAYQHHTSTELTNAFTASSTLASDQWFFEVALPYWDSSPQMLRMKFNDLKDASDKMQVAMASLCAVWTDEHCRYLSFVTDDTARMISQIGAHLPQ